MKNRVLSIILTLSMLVTIIAVPETVTRTKIKASADVYSEDGWSYDTETETLTVSGNVGTTAWRNGRSVESFRLSDVKIVVIEDGVTSIGYTAFYNCSSLETVTIPESVTSIADYAFRNCTALETITIPDSVTSIGSSAFYNCTALETITIPEGVTSIGNYAFQNCTALETITIPESVTSIGYNAFFGCSSLTAINVDSENKSYSSLDGVLFDKTQTTLIRYPEEKTQKSYIIPDSVTIIGDSAFRNCTSLEAITISESVTNIEDYAFYNCTALETITIPDSVTSIASNAFQNCTALETINIPDGVTSIGYNSFYNCTALETITIPDSVTSIGGSAFRNCTSLETITIPDSVTSIGVDAFNTTKWLNNQPDGIVYAGKVAYMWKGVMPADTSVILDSDTKGISDSAFSGKTNLISINIPDSVTSIGSSAFLGCTALESIVIGNGVTSIADYAFRNCTALETITIGTGVTIIGDSAFQNCTALETINIPDGVTSIGYNSFYNCTALETITIPDSVTSIASYTFSGCTALETITIGTGVTSIGDSAFQNCTALETINIPDGVTSIGYNSFYNCTALETITIPDSVTSIASYTFSGCTALETITIGTGVTSIGSYAFQNCASIETTVFTRATPPSINANAFFNADGDVTVFVPVNTGAGYKTALTGRLESFNVEETCFNCGECYVCDPCDCDECDNCRGFYGYGWHFFNDVLTIKSDSGTTTWRSGRDADTFRIADVKTVIIEDGVTSIGASAFQVCSSLESITIGNGVTSIGAYAFYYCTALESITIGDGVTSIGSSAFYNCTALETITIPEGVTSIGSSAFYNCTALKAINVDSENEYYLSLDGVLFNKSQTTLILYTEGRTEKSYVIPDGVTDIGNSAFYNCSSLESITIPDGVTNISNSAFYNCLSLESITISDGVTSIGNSAFSSCKSLATITLPDSLTSIGSSSFSNTSLETIVCPNGLPVNVISYSVFNDGLYMGAYKDAEFTIPADDFKDAGTYYIKYYESPTYGYRLSITGDDTATITGYYPQNAQEVLDILEIPSEIDGFKITAIGRAAFEAKRFKTLIIPDSVTSLGIWSFTKCSNLEVVYIGDGVKAIYGNAFYDCYNLREFNIGKSLETFNLGADSYYISLFGSNRLEAINVDPENVKYYDEDGVLFLKNTAVRNTLLFYPSSKIGYGYEIPENTDINRGAFHHNKNIKVLTFSNGVRLDSTLNNIFLNSLIQRIVLSEDYAEGTSLTFAAQNAQSLWSVVVPESVNFTTTYAASFFSGSPNAKIYCKDGSSVHEYAVTHNIPFSLEDPPENPNESTYDPSKFPQQKHPEENKKLSINFSPYTKGKSPEKGSVLAEDDIREMLKVLSPYADTVKIFGVDPQLEKIYKIAKNEYGMRILGGCWLDKYQTEEERYTALDKLIELTNAGYVDIAIVGSETILRGDLTVAKLVEYMEYVRDRITKNVPVTTSDTISAYTNNWLLMDSVDVIMVTQYPFYEGINAPEAITAVKGGYDVLHAMANGKQVIYGELGHPTAGSPYMGAVASFENAELYIKELLEWSYEENIEIVLFEFADEVWKSGRDIEKHFGLWTEDLKLKTAYSFLTELLGVEIPEETTAPETTTPDITTTTSITSGTTPPTETTTPASTGTGVSATTTTAASVTSTTGTGTATTATTASATDTDTATTATTASTTDTDTATTATTASATDTDTATTATTASDTDTGTAIATTTASDTGTGTATTVTTASATDTGTATTATTASDTGTGTATTATTASDTDTDTVTTATTASTTGTDTETAATTVTTAVSTNESTSSSATSISTTVASTATLNTTASTIEATGATTSVKVTTPAETTTPVSPVKKGIISTEGISNGEPTIFCFIEILLYLVKLPSKAENNTAAILSAEGKAAGEPTIFCGIEILQYLVGLTDGKDW